MPPTPPPDIDLDLWNASLDQVARWDPDTLFLTHFGPWHDARAHVAEMRERLPPPRRPGPVRRRDPRRPRRPHAAARGGVLPARRQHRVLVAGPGAILEQTEMTTEWRRNARGMAT